MKRGYKRLLIFEIIIFFMLLINSFFVNILGNYTTIIFLLLVIFIFKKFFGLEKDKHIYSKDIILDIIIFLLIFFLLYYLSGLFFGFARTGNYYNVKGIIDIIIPITLSIILKEILRYNIIRKSEGNKLLIVLSVILFIVIDFSIYFNGFYNKYDTFMFISLSLLPSISTNILCSYVTFKVGYKPNIVYSLIINLYQYLLPIIPNPNEYIVALIRFLLPIILVYRLSDVFKLIDEEELERSYSKNSIFSLVIPIIIVAILVYFTSGYFKYSTVAIASGSMEKEISKGDAVIIKKIGNKYEELEEGQVIAYNYNGVIIVHRIIEILKSDGEYFVYTKGDANHNPDNYVVKQEMIIGTVKIVLPFLGMPTVWLNEL